MASNIKQNDSSKFLLERQVNPFLHTIFLTNKDKIRIAFMSVTIAPLRIIFGFILILCAWVAASIGLFGQPRDCDIRLIGWRRWLITPVVRSFLRAYFFVLGFYKIKVQGHPVDSSEAPIRIAAPHSSFWDVVVGLVPCGELCSGLSRQENGDLPILGKVLRYMQPVMVSRSDKNSRQKSLQSIKERVNLIGEWPPLVIFPEGTTFNGTCLVTFKQGAFIAGCPVQPVCLRYHNKLNTMVWTWNGPNAFLMFWFTLCQFSIDLELKFLPVYVPSQKEKSDPVLYATNVRELMAREMKLPISDHTYQECVLMTYSSHLNLSLAYSLRSVNTLCKKLNIGTDDMSSAINKFSVLCQRKKNYVNFEEFTAYLEKPESQEIYKLFNLFEKESSCIDFREFTFAFALLTIPNNIKAKKIIFKIFDTNSKDFLTEKEMKDLLLLLFNSDESLVGNIINILNKEKSIRITLDMFLQYCGEIPHLVDIFNQFKES